MAGPVLRTSGDPSLVDLVAGVTERHHHRFTGLAVSARRGDRSATVCAGLTTDGGTAVGGDTSFQIGSVTKPFTALLLADAVVRGELELDRRLDTIVPGVTNHEDGPITLADLAMHTAGLPRLPRGLRSQALRNRRDPYAAFTDRQLLDALARAPRRPPGRRVRYSNYGAGVLGHALARALDGGYDRLVADRITRPLGLERTGIGAPVDGRDVAHGHDRRGRPVPDWHLPSMPGAGALRSTTTDLATFLAAHLHPAETPLDAAISLCTTPRRRVRRGFAMALGWMVVDRRGRARTWWHNGGTGGFFAFVGFARATAVAVTVLANTARSVDRIGMRLLDELADAT